DVGEQWHGRLPPLPLSRISREVESCSPFPLKAPPILGRRRQLLADPGGGGGGGGGGSANGLGVPTAALPPVRARMSPAMEAASTSHSPQPTLARANSVETSSTCRETLITS